MHELTLKTTQRRQMIDVTAMVAKVVADCNVQDGAILAYVPHTTAGITINENADPDVVHDILLTLEELIPHRRAGYLHQEGNSDAHVQASLMGSSVQVLIQRSQLYLGTWQGIYLWEQRTASHQRRVTITVQ